jgi:glycosyltransferase involved in cell wall biosynthesis
MVERLPAISVCIPTYNGAKYIAQTIESILNQTFTDFEVIVSDDGSSDKTLEIVGSFNDPRIVRIDRLSKVGAEANWNNAVATASASLVKLVCQDDLLYPQCLEVEVQTMSKSENQDVSFCFHLRDFVTPNSRKLSARRVGYSNLQKYSKTEILTKVVRSGGNPIGEPMAVTMRKLSLNSAGKFRGDYVIDLDMWSKLSDQGSALFIGQHLSAFRISKTSWTSNLKKSQLSSVRALSKKLQIDSDGAITKFDLLRGQIVGLVRAPVRQVASSLILLVDRLLGPAR